MNTTVTVPDRVAPTAVESVAVLVYFAIYIVYLFVYPEGELAHWVTLVLLPLTLVWWMRKSSDRQIRPLLSSIGLSREHLGRWLGWACLIGFGLGALQLAVSRHSEQIVETIVSGRVVYLFPLALLLMLLTAGATEEIFFRGILLTRLERLLGSRTLSLLLSSVLFGIYHVPYAYLNPRWPSAGDWGEAVATAMIQGVPGGLILGAVYFASGRNLVACMVTHSLINAAPAMGMIRFGGS